MTLTVKKVLKISKDMQTSNWLNIFPRYIAASANQGSDFAHVFEPFSDIFSYMDDFWATRRSLGAIKIATDSLDDVLHDPIICVSRSGKFTAFYIAYMCTMDVKKWWFSHDFSKFSRNWKVTQNWFYVSNIFKTCFIDLKVYCFLI